MEQRRIIWVLCTVGIFAALVIPHAIVNASANYPIADHTDGSVGPHLSRAAKPEEATATLTNFSKFFDEKESIVAHPNQSVPGCTALAFGQTFLGTIDPSKQVDCYSFNAGSGDLVRVRLFTSAIDPVFEVFFDGTPVCSQGQRSPVLIQGDCALADTGTYSVFVSDFGGDETGAYSLYLQRLTDPAGVTPIPFDSVLSGVIDPVPDTDAFSFLGGAGDVVRLRVSTSVIGPVVEVFSGTTLVCQGQSFPGLLQKDCTLADTGTHNVFISDLGGDETGDYELLLVCLNLPCGVAATPSFDLHQDPADGATGVKVGVTRVFVPRTGSDVDVALGSFQAGLTYLDASANPVFPAGTLCVNITDIREMDLPITDRSINNTSGVATFHGLDASGVAWPTDLGHVLTRLTGSAMQQCIVNLKLTSLTDGKGDGIAVPPESSNMVQRGDARADGVINIADALFIAQYLVGSRSACSETVDTTCLHSVNAASVRQDGAFDKKTIADALFIAQYLVGLRDEFYNLVP